MDVESTWVAPNLVRLKARGGRGLILPPTSGKGFPLRVKRDDPPFALGEEELQFMAGWVVPRLPGGFLVCL